MNVACCEFCSNIGTPLKILRPKDLENVFGVINELLSKKVLEEVPSKNEIKGDLTFDAISKMKGVLPDIIDLGFSCRRCSAKFRLFVETYHGFGGEFSRAGYGS